MKLVIEDGKRRLVLDLPYLAKTYGIDPLVAAYVEFSNDAEMIEMARRRTDIR